jgi:hypothetical protein
MKTVGVVTTIAVAAAVVAVVVVGVRSAPDVKRYMNMRRM